jgi:urate oxidase
VSIILGPSQYGKAEVRVVRIHRETPRHEIRDLNVSTSLKGNFSAAHLAGDQASVLPTDTQKNTAYAYAKTHGVSPIESYGLALARHFVEDVEPVTGALVEIEEYAWQRAMVDGVEHDHTWVRSGAEVRTAGIRVDDSGAAQVTGGLKDLVLLKSTGSEFSGFLRDEFTTLPETTDRVMATSLVAQWRFDGTELPWDAFYPRIRDILVRQFATVHSLALQQTLWHMGRAVLESVPEVAEITLSAPNKHHFVVDLAPFGLTNENEVFFAADRPYGLIQATVTRDDAVPALAPWAFRAGPA